MPLSWSKHVLPQLCFMARVEHAAGSVLEKHNLNYPSVVIVVVIVFGVVVVLAVGPRQPNIKVIVVIVVGPQQPIHAVTTLPTQTQ